MRVKRYVVDSMPDALQRIRHDLGKDAVILNTKEVRSGGFMGFFVKKKIEVIAAIDQTAAHMSLGVEPVHSPGLSAPAPAAATASYASSPALETAPISRTASSVGVLEHAGPGAYSADKREDMLMDEIRKMKVMVQQLSFISKDQRRMPEAFRKLERRLLDQEVEPDLVHAVIQDAMELAGALQDQISDDQAAQLIRKPLRQILKCDGKKGISPDTRIVNFVGPTGVGKTTTIAKLAAEQVLKYNRKVGFITTDTYRIAAVEQLKTYATILNVPLEVIVSPQEAKRAFQQLADKDIVFMDTAGRNYRKELYVSELNSLLHSSGQSETFLVLSLTSKYRDMKVITENFSKFKLDKVLFTKSDETESYGAILNIANEFPLTLSYITNGQNVPDDIGELNEEELIDLILEEHGDE